MNGTSNVGVRHTLHCCLAYLTWQNCTSTAWWVAHQYDSAVHAFILCKKLKIR